MTRAKRDGSPDDLWFAWWRNEPWPDEFVEAMVSPLPDYEPEPDTAKFLAYQVAIRVRQRLPVPPLLQEWFNRYVALEDGYVPQLLPDRQVFDRAAVEFPEIDVRHDQDRRDQAHREGIRAGSSKRSKRTCTERSLSK